MTGYHIALICGILLGMLAEHVVMRLTGHSLMGAIVRVGGKGKKK